MSALRSSPDVVIAGAGIIGLSLALELHSRGTSVAVLDPARALRQTSWAAAGMLAADDPHNPEALRPLARFSESLYPGYLQHIQTLSGLDVPFQTDTVVQYLPSGVTRTFAEHSIDPRQLVTALLSAVRARGIALYENTGRWDFADFENTLHIRTHSGVELHPTQLVHASGAWFQGRQIITPRKGQMLRVAMPPSLDLGEVHRRADIYLVPRTQGPQSGTVVIGATDEDAGYDLRTHTHDRLRALAAELLPAFASATDAPVVESWAGLRPGTPDNLPLLGALSPRQYAATGHYRNGILLAPATAIVMADFITGKAPTIDLAAFNPERFL
jgi:glycine oxidase